MARVLRLSAKRLDATAFFNSGWSGTPGGRHYKDAMRLIGRHSPISRTTIDKYTEGIAVSSERIRTLLGFVPEYNLAAGWRDTVQEMREAVIFNHADQSMERGN